MRRPKQAQAVLHSKGCIAGPHHSLGGGSFAPECCKDASVDQGAADPLLFASTGGPLVPDPHELRLPANLGLSAEVLTGPQVRGSFLHQGDPKLI